MNIATQIIINIITSTTVSALIIFVFKTYISEKIKSSIKAEYDRRLEDFKSKIKQIEYLRDNRYEALKALIPIYFEIGPEKWHPDMDWEDALRDVAGKFENSEVLLTNFLKNFGHVLDKEISDLVEIGISQCVDGKFEEGDNQYNYAKKLFESVQNARELLFNKLEVD